MVQVRGECQWDTSSVIVSEPDPPRSVTSYSTYALREGMMSQSVVGLVPRLAQSFIRRAHLTIFSCFQ